MEKIMLTEVSCQKLMKIGKKRKFSDFDFFQVLLKKITFI